MPDISLLQFVRVCVNPAIRATKLQSSRVGRMADRSDCRNLRLSWLLFSALLRELVPNAETIAVLQDPNFSQYQAVTREIEAAAGAMGQKIITVNASNPPEIDAAFSSMVQSGAGKAEMSFCARHVRF